MKYIVTGGAGFIGSNIVKKLVARGDNVVVIDNLNTGKEENLASVKDKIIFLKDDILNVSFQGRRVGNPVDGLSYIQFCDAYGFLDSGSFQTGSGFNAGDNGKTSFMHTQFSLPVGKLNTTGSYGEKSFVAQITPSAKYEVITMVISGISNIIRSSLFISQT